MREKPEIIVVGACSVLGHLEALQALVDRGTGVGVIVCDLEMTPDEVAARFGQEHERVSHPPLPPEPVEIELKPLYDPVLFDRPAPTHPTSPRASWRRRR
ncbi:hypothetical protein [Aureimonas sp. AU40]|uniref:hypothetical protein n=1 Tax=Aureimonas sp. AU40 TaxID=1637747 RepID=UPI00078292B8|nr:hypothetical protein [Aureimonas sp. AU40]